jgi:phenylalanyl-tRNA synthetase alpha chain
MISSPARARRRRAPADRPGLLGRRRDRAVSKELEALSGEFHRALGAAGSDREVAELKVRFLGRKGSLTAILKGLGALSAEERQTVGQLANRLKVEFEAALDARREDIEKESLARRLEAEWLDVTLDAGRRPPGCLHPTSQVQYEIEDVFTAMGFQILDGPEVETELFNFEALNTPPDHPARDLQDTFYLEDGNLLRTHTSTIQVRGMKRLRPPFKIIGPGKVFRCERIDASHESTFHQLEGMMVARDVKVAHLIHSMKTLLSRIFGREEEVRLRPGYFPFVEPGFELDIRCRICGGGGCSVCKHVGWVELLPCGMVHPNVLRAGDIDPEVYSGFAFGLGLDRLVMMRYRIEDIRHIHGADLRFLRQFA